MIDTEVANFQASHNKDIIIENSVKHMLTKIESNREKEYYVSVVLLVFNKILLLKQYSRITLIPVTIVLCNMIS